MGEGIVVGGGYGSGQGSHGHTVCPTRLDKHVFEVMLDRVNRVFGCRSRSSNGSTNLTLVGGASLSNVWFECVNSRQTSNLTTLRLDVLSAAPFVN